MKGEVNQMQFLVSFNTCFGLIVGLTPKTSVEGVGVCRLSLSGIAKGEQGQLVSGVYHSLRALAWV